MKGERFMKWEDMKNRKRELGYSNAQLSELSGVPLGTLNKILSGDTKAPRYATLQAIEKALFPEKRNEAPPRQAADAGRISEGKATYGKGPTESMTIHDKKDVTLSCVDCGTQNCLFQNSTYPDFCLSTHLDQDLLAEAMKEYEKPEIKKIALSAAEVEADNYCKMTRIEETIEFAKKIGAKKIGVATCAGLVKESRMVVRILRKRGFEPISIACKCGTQKKVDIGAPERCEAVGVYMCNPILQAKYLNSQHTDLNILVGLCVGHDSMFYKYADAPVTTLIAKDRVLGHNPVAALYQAEQYYHRLLDD